AQSWREAEMLACARLRLLTAEGAFDAARELAAALQTAAAERGAVRMGMRGLALSAVLEHRAGEDGRARGHVAGDLRLDGQTDYAWPLARERGAVVPLLEDIAGDRKADAAVRAAAGGLRDAMADGAEAAQARPLNGGEMEVLALLEGRSDREIGEALKLSHDGVRSRLRRIFAALGARGRHDAVHRARAQGLLPPADDAPPSGS
ncbi:MAG: helix-turn-helix transcriptional regulator, partial [Rhodospirillales bacterium]|nr:helix-turn-helix transcriptional regulator [Rhodospirillales bacterium]